MDLWFWDMGRNKSVHDWDIKGLEMVICLIFESGSWKIFFELFLLYRIFTNLLNQLGMLVFVLNGSDLDLYWALRNFRWTRRIFYVNVCEWLYWSMRNVVFDFMQKFTSCIFPINNIHKLHFSNKFVRVGAIVAIWGCQV